MATEVRSIPAQPTLKRRSASRLRLLSDHPTLHLPDAHAQNEDDVTRSTRGSATSQFMFTQLTPILASPVLSPTITTATPTTPSASLNPDDPPQNSSQDSDGVINHKRSRSTLSRLHVPLSEDYFNTQNHVRSATAPGQPSGSPPSPSLFKDTAGLDGISVASVAPKLPRPRTKSVRKSFTIGSDGEDDTSEQEQKREAAAKAKKLEKYDDLRRYHALMELLKTEAKYLQDLRVLINVYLQQLHHAATSRATSSYFGTSASSSKQATSPSPSTFNSPPTQGQTTGPPPLPAHPSSTVRRRSVGAIDHVDTEKDSSPTRPIFTEEDIQLLCRNSSEILAFHEGFVDDLKEALAPLGSKFRFDTEDEFAYVDMPRHDTLELAIQIIVSMFVDRAQSFKLYQSFCSTHSEAVELVQRSRRASPADWEAWEKWCRKCVVDNHRCSSPPVPSTSTATQSGLDGDSSPSPQGDIVARSQTTKNKRPHSFMASKPSRANTAPPHLLSRHGHHNHSQSPRLEFLDHMIKPVQRICKYHLLLDQLKSRVPNPGTDLDATFDSAELFSAGQTESLVSHAFEAMREVVNSVNDGRRKHEDRWKVLLIASRTVPLPAASSPSPHPQLTPEFLTTLGNCLMSGALDVIYHRPTVSAMTKAKYLGAFLYEQGYLALVKVGKGKAYEPQHWFPLRDFDVFDLNDEDGTFPYSFHVTGEGHHFQFAAACQREKELWMEGLRKAIVAAAESDSTELPSSLLDENKEEVAPNPSVTIRDAPTEGLPTIQSETEHIEDLLASRPGITKALSDFKALCDDGHSIRTDPRSHSQPVSRRGSSNSVRAIFTPFLFDSGVRLVRPTAVQRHHTDQALADVFSDSCRDARNLAELQNQEFFQLPRLVTRSKSGAAVSGLRGRKDSIFNRRSYGGPSATLSSSSPNSTPPTTEKKVKQKKERPSSVMVFTQSRFGEDSTMHSTSSSQTPSLTIPSTEEGQTHTSPDVATSLCSSEATSNVGSALNSPTGSKSSPLNSPLIHAGGVTTSFENCPGVDKDYRPKRSKSMVDNVKAFFTSHSKRPPRRPPTEVDLLVDSLSLARGRTQSSPTSYLPDPLEPSLPSVAVHPVDIDLDTDTPTSDRPYLPPPTDRGRDPVDALGRKRSLFTYGPRRGTDISRLSAMSTVSTTSSATETSGSSSPVRRRSVKDILLHFRNS